MIVIGKNVALELLNNNKKINKIYLYDNFNDKNLLNEINKRNISVIYKSKQEMFKIDNGNHQGIIMDIPDYKYFDLEEVINNKGFLVILDHLEDTHNFGAIIRTCEAAGVDGIIIPEDRSVDINSTVMKTSSGALDNIKIVKVININNTIDKLKEIGYWIIGTSLDTDQLYDKQKYIYPLALIIGNEGKGISRLTKEKCDAVVKIPMKGKINSLNASVSAGIMIYEIIKFRN